MTAVVGSVPRLLCCCLLLFVLSGCFRSDDPLDWKIDASDAFELQAWTDGNLPLMPDELSREVVYARYKIRDDTHAAPATDSLVSANRLAARLKGHTIREVLIEAYGLGIDSLDARIANSYGAIQRIVQTQDSVPADQQARWQRQLESHQQTVKALKEELEKATRRLEELRSQAAKAG